MKRKSRGQALVEFALVFPIIMTFLFATIELGYFVYSWSQANYAARRGGEQASSGPPLLALSKAEYQQVNNGPNNQPDPCVSLIRAAAMRTTIGLNQSMVDIAYFNQYNDIVPRIDRTLPNDYRRAGNIIQVQVNYVYVPLTPVGSLLLNNRRIDATSRRTIMRYDFSNIDPLSACQ
ncbi:TadE/TadG family type IV pilus assembly protein [Herpetosiphon geysericola]|uniref:TadE-like domain-containing protein n=1 Tax=Herpetosiphon geysericola TaxID=70996 RepID=A0A0P6XRW0_9CHLR|nr:TadE/TadG family type IV pilus assembly protein [Herpetosiphon geysericola]KPL85427.1 hypothetical protein SE18_17470 [Herpetosiphon geysericola]